MSSLTGPQKQQLHNAILAAFRENDLAELLLFDMDVRMRQVVEAGPLRIVVFDLIDWVDQQGRINEFLTAIARARPHKEEVQRVVATLHPQLRHCQP
jgi:Effector-associated domain 1